MAANALNLPVWTRATWTALSPAIKETRAVPGTRVASVYDADKLYIAFVGVEADKGTSSTSVWLDTSLAQNGTEVFEIVADASPVTTAPVRAEVWHRCVVPPEARETPNFAIPMMHLPNVRVAGLKVQTNVWTLEGKPAWSVVYAIPVQALPEPLRARMKPGETTWRVNLLRQDVTTDAGDPAKREMLQTNLSPVYPGAQAVMPYRMASLVIAAPAGGPVAVRPVARPSAE